MEFDFLNPPAIVQQKKKYATFTVREIGGPEEIIKWRAEQEAKESIYRLRLGERDKRLDDFSRLIGQPLDTPKVGVRNWKEKLEFAKSERERLSKAEQAVIDYPPWEPPVIPPKTIFQKIKDFCRSLWKSANFSHYS